MPKDVSSRSASAAARRRLAASFQGATIEVIKPEECSEMMAPIVFSRTVSSPKRAFCWKVRRSPRAARSQVGTSVTRRPSRNTSPAWATLLVTAAKQLLLPAPLGPMIPRIRPASTSHVMRSSATRAP